MKFRIGIGRITASGGNGFAGGGGGRISVDIFSRHDDPVIAVHGMTCDLIISSYFGFWTIEHCFASFVHYLSIFITDWTAFCHRIQNIKGVSRILAVNAT